MTRSKICTIPGIVTSLFLLVTPMVSCSEESDVTNPDTAVASVTITPESASIPVGGTVELEAVPRDAAGNALGGRSIEWSSRDPAVAPVDASGVVTGESQGSTTVTARSEGKTGTASITVVGTPEGTIVVNPGTTYQTISGWEATAEIGQADFQPAEFLRWRDAVIDSAVAVGLNRMRLEIRSGAENPVDYHARWRDGSISRREWASHWYEIVNDNGDAYSMDPTGFQFSELDEKAREIVEPMRQALADRGEELYVNLTYVDFGGSSFEHRDHPEEYGELILATFQHLESTFGWVPDGVNIILEPENASWNGTRIGQAIAALGQRLDGAGYRPDIIAPSTTSMENASPYFDEAIAVSEALGYFSELSYHRYHGVSTENLQAIASRADQHGLRTAMLEHIGSGYRDLHRDLTIGMNSAWQQFALAFPGGDHGSRYLYVDRETGDVHVGAAMRSLRQYFEYVRRDAVRIGATSQDDELAPVAFVHPGGAHVVVVKADAARSFSIQGLPAGTYGVTYTAGDAYHEDAGDVTVAAGGLLEASIPASGVITIFGK